MTLRDRCQRCTRPGCVGQVLMSSPDWHVLFMKDCSFTLTLSHDLSGVDDDLDEAIEEYD